MNRDMLSGNDSFSTKLNHTMGEQPRRLMSRKTKKESRFEYDSDDIEIDRHRQNYKRAAAKFATRIQLNANEISF